MSLPFSHTFLITATLTFAFLFLFRHRRIVREPLPIVDLATLPKILPNCPVSLSDFDRHLGLTSNDDLTFDVNAIAFIDRFLKRNVTSNLDLEIEKILLPLHELSLEADQRLIAAFTNIDIYSKLQKSLEHGLLQRDLLNLANRLLMIPYKATPAQYQHLEAVLKRLALVIVLNVTDEIKTEAMKLLGEIDHILAVMSAMFDRFKQRLAEVVSGWHPARLY